MRPTLYLIMRSDLYDNSPGKMMAQAAHAQADFDARLLSVASYAHKTPAMTQVLEDHAEWTGGYGFGRTIVLSATKEKIQEVCSCIEFSGATEDPTYPWKNFYGERFTSKEITCGWVFIGPSNEEDIIHVQDLPTHK